MLQTTAPWRVEESSGLFHDEGCKRLFQATVPNDRPRRPPKTAAPNDRPKRPPQTTAPNDRPKRPPQTTAHKEDDKHP